MVHLRCGVPHQPDPVRVLAGKVVRRRDHTRSATAYPATVNLEPFSVNDVPDALTNPVAVGGAAVEVGAVELVVLDTGTVVGTGVEELETVAAPGRHWE